MARDYQLKPSPFVGESQIDYRAELNDQQYAAVTSPPGQSLVIAGAGSGKTRTLTYRVAYLLDNGIQPENILLLTFTNKASREMLERVKSLLDVDTFKMWGGTFHSIGNRMLRKHAEAIGLSSGFSILDREDQKDLLETVVKSSGVETTAHRFPKAEVLGDIFSLCVNTNTDVKTLVHEKYEYFIPVCASIEKLQRLYEQKKLDTNTVDFDDLLVLPLKMLKEYAELLSYYQKKFQFILVDEYQDTNALQCELIDLLTGESGNLMVVGDDAQSIYSWRGADLRNILEFQSRYSKAKIYKIEVNYRSVPEVLNLANVAIEANSGQFRKALQPSRSERGVLPGLIPLDTSSAQANFVAQRILEIHDEGIEFRDIAVIYRAHYHSLEIQLELTNRGIPFQITSGLRFFEQAHVKDVACFVKFVANPKDEVSFMRLVRMVPGIGTISAMKIWSAWLAAVEEIGKLTSESILKALLGIKVPKKSQSVWEQTAYTLSELVDAEGALAKPSQMIQSVVEGVYLEYMRTKFKNAEQRRQDLEQLSNYSTKFEDLNEFLTQLALVSGVETDQQAKTRDENAVTLTTAHQAKGLEWHTVFAVWLAEGMFPNHRVLEEGGEEGLEEERRLFYVTVTRAKDELYLTYPVLNFQARDGEVMQRPSRFLSELPSDLMEPWNVRSVFS